MSKNFKRIILTTILAVCATAMFLVTATSAQASELQPPQWHWILMSSRTKRVYYQFAKNFEFKPEALSAIHSWNKAMGYHIIEPADQNHPTTVYLGNLDEPLANDIAMTNSAGAIYFNTAFKTDCEKTSVYRHEFGHVLGLDDTRDQVNDCMFNDVMYEYGNIKHRTTIQKRDVDAVKTAIKDDLKKGQTINIANLKLVASKTFGEATIFGCDIKTIEDHPAWMAGTNLASELKASTKDFTYNHDANYLKIMQKELPVIKQIIRQQGYNDWLKPLEK